MKPVPISTSCEINAAGKLLENLSSHIFLPVFSLCTQTFPFFLELYRAHSFP